MAGLSALLVLLGAGWGLTQPLGKIAVSTGYRHFGLVFWQLVIGALVLAVIARATGRRLPLDPPRLRLYAFIALIGTVIPNAASYSALAHIPAGLQSVLMSLVPVAAFPIAMALGMERFDIRRLMGLGLGLAGVLLLVLPDASLPDPAAAPWALLTLIAVGLYAFEGNYVAKWGTRGTDPIQLMYGASLVGLVLTLPLALATGGFISPLPPYGAPDLALLVASVVHVLVYTGYVWLVGQAGAVFTAQVGYAVTATGILWAMLILGETYSPFFWIAAAMILCGVFLVRPRQKDALAPAPAIGENGRRA